MNEPAGSQLVELYEEIRVLYTYLSLVMTDSNQVSNLQGKEIYQQDPEK